MTTQAPNHPTHHFHGTAEGVLCHDCDARPGRAAKPCPAYLDEARATHAAVARLLLRVMPPGPTPPPHDAGAAASRAWEHAAAEWRNELDIREASCRSLARLLELEVGADDTLPQMAKR